MACVKSEIKLASKDDIIDYLSSVMLGHSSSSTLVTTKTKTSMYTEEIFKPPNQKESLKACELLFKCVNTQSVSNISSVIIDDLSLDNLCNNINQNFNGDVNRKKIKSNPEMDNILSFLSSVMFGTCVCEVMVNVKDDCNTYSEQFSKHPSEEERLKAAEMLAKFYDIFADNSSALPTILGRNYSIDSNDFDSNDFDSKTEDC